jgi:hypothetical protein
LGNLKGFVNPTNYPICNTHIGCHAKTTCQTWHMQNLHINKFWLGKQVGFQILQYNNGHSNTHMYVLHGQPTKPMKNLGMWCGYGGATMLQNVVHDNYGCEYCMVGPKN